MDLGMLFEGKKPFDFENSNAAFVSCEFGDFLSKLWCGLRRARFLPLSTWIFIMKYSHVGSYSRCVNCSSTTTEMSLNDEKNNMWMNKKWTNNCESIHRKLCGGTSKPDIGNNNNIIPYKKWQEITSSLDGHTNVKAITVGTHNNICILLKIKK